jgi:hypothetical protein
MTASPVRHSGFPSLPSSFSLPSPASKAKENFSTEKIKSKKYESLKRPLARNKIKIKVKEKHNA